MTKTLLTFQALAFTGILFSAPLAHGIDTDTDRDGIPDVMEQSSAPVASGSSATSMNKSQLKGQHNTTKADLKQQHEAAKANLNSQQLSKDEHKQQRKALKQTQKAEKKDLKQKHKQEQKDLKQQHKEQKRTLKTSQRAPQTQDYDDN